MLRFILRAALPLAAVASVGAAATLPKAANPTYVNQVDVTPSIQQFMNKKLFQISKSRCTEGFEVTTLDFMSSWAADQYVKFIQAEIKDSGAPILRKKIVANPYQLWVIGKSEGDSGVQTEVTWFGYIRQVTAQGHPRIERYGCIVAEVVK